MQLSTLLAFSASVLAQTALDVVLGSKDHTTLASLAATLPPVLDVLKSAGPLTLFAPTNDAFAKLDAETLKAVSADSALLTQVLQYHVIAGVAFDPKTAPKQSFPQTALGLALGVTVSDKVVLAYGLGNSMVTASVHADNGVVHVVDTVLIPPPSASATAVKAKLNELVKALTSAKLVEAVDGVKGATIFAPTDAAFESLFKFAKDTGLEITPALLDSILKLHVVPSVVYSTDIVASTTDIVAPALSKENVTVKLIDGAVKVSGPGNKDAATVVTADVIYNNGVVHVIDTVLLPKDLTSMPTEEPVLSSASTSFAGLAIASTVIAIFA